MQSRYCAQGTHAWCEDTRCECPTCHFVCANCDERVRAIYDGWCAPCSRERARKTPFRGTPCDQCGSLGAVRNPRHRRNEYLCTSCHQKSGESLQLVGSVSGALASCASKPLEDAEHEFLRVRGARYRCSRCQQDFFGSSKQVNVVGEVRGWR